MLTAFCTRTTTRCHSPPAVGNSRYKSSSGGKRIARFPDIPNAPVKESEMRRRWIPGLPMASVLGALALACAVGIATAPALGQGPRTDKLHGQDRAAAVHLARTTASGAAGSHLTSGTAGT